LEDLRSIRLVSMIEQNKGRKGLLKVNYRLEKIHRDLGKTAKVLGVTQQNIRPKLPFGVYIS